MDRQIFEQHESQVRSYCRNFPTVFTHASGSLMFSSEGKRYIDFFAGAGALNYGHNHPFLKQKLMEYLAEDGILHALDMHTEAKAAFLESFCREILVPRGMGDYRVMFTGPTGTNAVEAALKLARKVKGRENVLALMGAFHGMTLGALALTTDQVSREGAGLSLDHVVHIPTPYQMGEQPSLAYLEMLLTDDHSGLARPAALVIETMQAEGGIQVFSTEYLRELRRISTEQDMLLIVDDVQAGCGRTGTFFSFERAGILPDMFILSKSISGIGLPMALLVTAPQYDIWRPAEHNGTFRGNQLAFVAARWAFDLLAREDILAGTRRKGELVADFIAKEILPLDSRLEMRGTGLAWGIDVIGIDPTGDLAKTMMNHCFERGLILERVGRKNAVLKIMPPLVIEDEMLREGLDILREAIRTVLKK